MYTNVTDVPYMSTTDFCSKGNESHYFIPHLVTADRLTCAPKLNLPHGPEMKK